MADYLRIFSTMADYEAYIAGSYDKPNVSYIEATGETIYTNYEDEPAGPDTVLESVKIADFTGTTFNAGTSYITEANVPEGVTSIGSSAFKNYIALTSVTLPSTLTTINSEAFRACNALTSIDIPAGVTAINQTAFDNCIALTSVNFLGVPALTTIGNYSFNGCIHLASIDIPAGVTAIGQEVFRDCKALTSIDIPAGVTSIGNSAFNGCIHLASIDIPAGVTAIGQEVFRDCTSLTSVTVNATTPPTLSAYVFNNTPANMVIYVPAESVETYKAASGWSTYASKIQAIPSE